jgi:hypothetical protein
VAATLEFKDGIFGMQRRAKSISSRLTNEEASKIHLVMPFLEQLGYSIKNYDVLIPEYPVNLVENGKSTVKRADFAIMDVVKQIPAIVVECKSISEGTKKSSHWDQLKKYFENTPAQFGLLTDGLIYSFYTAVSDKDSHLNPDSCFAFNLMDFNEADLEMLELFSRSKLNIDTIFDAILKQQKKVLLQQFMDGILTAPPVPLVHYLLGVVLDKGFEADPSEYSELMDFIKGYLNKAANPDVVGSVGRPSLSMPNDLEALVGESA